MSEQTMETTDIDRFLGYVDRAAHREDRGVLADLRRGFSPGTEYRTWPHIAQFCNLADERMRRIYMTVGAGCAFQEGSAGAGDMGLTLRTIALDNHEGGDKALSTYEARFRRILTATTAVEVCGLLTGVLRIAARKGISVNYRRLFWDLVMWDNPEKKIKMRWARSFWKSGSGDTVEGGDAS